MKYLLVLDTYAHSAMDNLFYELHPTIESCKNRVQQLLADNKITMLYNGDAKHKIYVISISRKISEDEYLRIERSYDGKNWENMKDEHPATTYSKAEVARGKSIKLHIEEEMKMKKMVNVINGNNGETVLAADVITTGQASPTNRILEPYLAAEYQEPAVLPDGRKCLKVYQFDEDEVKDAQADDNDAWEEDLPWNEEHVDHVVVIDD